MIHINREVFPPEPQGCPSGLHREHQHKDGEEWHAMYEPGNMLDNPVNFALFGLARQTEEHFPDWVPANPLAGPILDLGPGNKLIVDADRLDYPEYDFDDPKQSLRASKHSYAGVSVGYPGWLPYADNSVAGVFAVNIFEHLWDPRPIMAECARVLRPGAPFNIFVPHGLSGMYLQDLDHKKPFNLDSF